VAPSHIGRVRTRVWTLKQAVSTCLCSTTRSSVARSLASWDLISCLTVIALLRMNLLYKRTLLFRQGHVAVLKVSECLLSCSHCLWFQFSFLFFARVVFPVWDLHCSLVCQDTIREKPFTFSKRRTLSNLSCKSDL